MNNHNKYFLILIIPIIFLTGCSSIGNAPPPNNIVDRTMTDYSFLDVSNNCEIHKNIDLDNDTNLCTLDKKPYTLFFTEEHNWSLMCCEYNDKCLEYNNENISDICLDTTNKYSGYVFNDQGFWMAQCCDENGANCYVDLNVDINNDSTICDEKLNRNTYSLNFNGTLWNSMCCVGGLEE